MYRTWSLSLFSWGIVILLSRSVSTSLALSPSKKSNGFFLRNPRQQNRSILPLTIMQNGDGKNAESPSGEDDNNQELKDFRAETSAIFNNIRIPAALFAGASAGLAFAMPINEVSEGLKVGLVKRVYSLLILGSLSSEVIAVVVSTLSVGLLSTCASPKARTLSEFISKNYALPWVSTRFHFLSGVLLFLVGVGLRAWVTVVCPIFAWASLGLISSATLFCLAFLQDMGQNEQFNGVLTLPLIYVKLFFKKARKSPLFASAFILYAITAAYVLYNVPHVWVYLAKTT